jgi:hypothetical protein
MEIPDEVIGRWRNGIPPASARPSARQRGPDLPAAADKSSRATLRARKIRN